MTFQLLLCFDVSVVLLSTPAIIEQPKSIEKHPIGLPVEFSVRATGPVYLWTRTDEKPLDGDRFQDKDSPCLKIRQVKAEDEGSYHCTVSSGANQLVSNAASLTIGKTCIGYFNILVSMPGECRALLCGECELASASLQLPSMTFYLLGHKYKYSLFN